MSELENCMESFIGIFHQYAEEDGDKQYLNKKELKKLIESQLPHLLKNHKDPKTVDKIMFDLDRNKDQKLDFEEFLPLIFGILVPCEKWCWKQKKKELKGKGKN